MSKMQVLVAAMKQTDLSLTKKMNIQCNAIIADQHGTASLWEQTTEYGNIKMITTPT